MSREQFEIIDEDGAAIYRHRDSGFIGAVNHGSLAAGSGVTIREGSGNLARMLASTALLTFPNARFQIYDPANVYAPGLWVVGYAKDGTTPVFRPVGKQCLAAAIGSVAHPVQVLTGAISGTFAAKPTLPAGLAFPGLRGHVKARVRKTGTTNGATYTVNLGTAGNATDALLASITVTAASPPRDAEFDFYFDFYDATTVCTSGQNGVGIDQAGKAADVTTNINTAQIMKLSISCASAAADSNALENIALYLEAF